MRSYDEIQTDIAATQNDNAALCRLCEELLIPVDRLRDDDLATVPVGALRTARDTLMSFGMEPGGDPDADRVAAVYAIDRALYARATAS